MRKINRETFITDHVTHLIKVIDKTRTMGHFGTSQNIPEHGIINISKRKICKIKFSKIKFNKNKLVSTQKNKTKQKKKRKKERNIKMTYVCRLTT